MRASRIAGVALVVLTVAIVPSSALGQAADDEYSLNIPGASSGNGESGTSTTSGAAVPESSKSGSAAPASTDAPSQAASTPSADGGAGDGKAGASGGGGSKNANRNPGAASSTPPDREAAPATLSTPTDDGGSPVTLIVLAAIAAIATAAAIWRLRQRGDGDSHGVDRSTAVVDEPQSL